MERFGKLDVLVNNAGVLEMGSIENTSMEQYDRVMGTNMRAVYHLTMMAVPHLEVTRGNIVNVSSVNGIRSFPGNALNINSFLPSLTHSLSVTVRTSAGVLAYNVSKAALDQFTRCVSLELAAKQIRVNSVNPGVIVTELQKRGGLDTERYEKFLEHSKTTHALGRPGEAGEVRCIIRDIA